MILTLLPDASPLSGAAGELTLGVADPARALHALRGGFSDHRAIATLPGWTVTASDGVCETVRTAIEERLCEFLSDLGNSPLDSWWGASNAMGNSAFAAGGLKHADFIGKAAGVPAVVIASGPSAAKHIEWIKANQSHAVVIVADSSFIKCAEAGINADFVTLIERDKCMSRLVPGDVSPSTMLVCPPVVSPECITTRKTVWWWQPTAGLYSWLGPSVPVQATGRSAGTMGVALAGILGCSPIILVGHDLSYSDGASHSPLADAMATANHRAAAGMNGDALHQDEECTAEDGSPIGTCRFWQLARVDLESFAADNPGRMVKLGREGARISGVECITDAPLLPHSWLPYWPDATKYQSRNVSGLAKTLQSDLISLMRHSEITSFDRKSYMEGLESLQPAHWASNKTKDLHAYVHGTIYHAATLRMFLRQADPTDALGSSWRLLKRGLMTMVARMVKECP